jgi:hypothetical protein
MKESAARARAVSILKHRLDHRSAVSTPAIIGVGSNVEDANPITDQNAETGADRNSLFFGQPSRHPRSAQNGGRAKRREQFHRSFETGGHCNLISRTVFDCGATNVQRIAIDFILRRFVALPYHERVILAGFYRSRSQGSQSLEMAGRHALGCSRAIRRSLAKAKVQ